MKNIWECAPHSNYFQSTLFLMLYYSTSLKSTATFFISGYTEYLPVHFQFKMAPVDYSVAEILATQFWVHQKNIDFQFFQNLSNLCCLYLSNQISFRGCFVFKRMGGYPLSPEVKNVAVAFRSREIKQQKSVYFENH